MVRPRYSSDGQLLAPENYRELVFIGASLGMDYRENQPPPAAGEVGSFHNTFIQPEAYKQYVATGTFPDKTMLVLEIALPGGKASINKAGHFEDKLRGFEVAVKDEKRFPEKWAYFNFIGKEGKPLPEAKPFPKQACWSCHNEHGAVDNVFVQFYRVLREEREKTLAARK